MKSDRVQPANDYIERLTGVKGRFHSSGHLSSGRCKHVQDTEEGGGLAEEVLRIFLHSESLLTLHQAAAEADRKEAVRTPRTSSTESLSISITPP